MYKIRYIFTYITICKKNISCLRLSSVPTKMLLKLPTFIGFAETEVSLSLDTLRDPIP